MTRYFRFLVVFRIDNPMITCVFVMQWSQRHVWHVDEKAPCDTFESLFQRMRRKARQLCSVLLADMITAATGRRTVFLPPLAGLVLSFLHNVEYARMVTLQPSDNAGKMTTGADSKVILVFFRNSSVMCFQEPTPVPLERTFDAYLPSDFRACSPACALLSPDLHLRPRAFKLLPCSPKPVLQQVHPEGTITMSDHAHAILMSMAGHIVDILTRHAVNFVFLRDRRYCELLLCGIPFMSMCV